MAYSKRTPPVKVILTIDMYNTLLEAISKNENNSDIEVVDEFNRLKEKILRYSIPFNEDGLQKVEVPFFIRESSSVIYQLIISYSNLQVTTNYYAILLKIREEHKFKNQL